MSDLARVAKMRIQRDPEFASATISVAVPRDIGDREFAILHKPIIERIRDITGCPCLSGRVKVVLEDLFNEVIQVDLKTGAMTGR